ncbi:MAG: hypothetical protein ACYTG6_14440 [Planctomycetota bacterium]|jgi:hypothetical protein
MRYQDLLFGVVVVVACLACLALYLTPECPDPAAHVEAPEPGPKPVLLEQERDCVPTHREVKGVVR